ncbi:MAG: helix-turn-helix transcriptional regulator [Nostoc sp.]|uniref:helix-turn-helix domain-containing protein n=1 Tax=Nostoc sp. TaxID=1180 RepID=UPI002FF83835
MTIKKPLLIKQPEVGQLIGELRGITSLTQEQFAASLGITYSTVKRCEKGHTKPSSLAMQKIQGMLEEMGLGQKVSMKYLSNKKAG